MIWNYKPYKLSETIYPHPTCAKKKWFACYRLDIKRFSKFTLRILRATAYRDFTAKYHFCESLSCY